MSQYELLKKIKNVKTYNKDIFNALCFSGAVVLATNMISPLVVFNKDSINQDEVLSEEGKVSFNDLRSTLNNNNRMNIFFKPGVKRFIDYLEKYYPDADLRKFNHNLSDLVIYNNKLTDIFTSYEDLAGMYKPFFNEIDIDSKYNKSDIVLFHELIHACTECHYDHYLISSKDDNNYGNAVLEMLSDYYSSRDWNNNRHYSSLKDFAEPLVAVTNFSFDDFCNGGIYLFEERLNEQGLDAKQIINYLDDVVENEKNKKKISDYDKKYSTDLIETCYKKILDNFKTSNYDDITNYLCSIKKNIPGRGEEFDKYMRNHCKQYLIDTNKIKKIIKRTIKQIIYCQLGLYKDNKYSKTINEYDILVANSQIENNNSILKKKYPKDMYKLVKTDDFTMTLDVADEILEKYSNYLSHFEDYVIDPSKLENLFFEKRKIEKKKIDIEIDDTATKLIDEYKKTNNINDNLNIVWYDSIIGAEKIKNQMYPFYLKSMHNDKYYFDSKGIKANMDLINNLSNYYRLNIKKNYLTEKNNEHKTNQERKENRHR